MSTRQTAEGEVLVASGPCLLYVAVQTNVLLERLTLELVRYRGQNLVEAQPRKGAGEVVS